MSERVCSIGVDFGTESGRALLIDARTGEPLAVSVVPYASAVIDSELPAGGERLPPDWALQDPDDWVAVLEQAIPEVVATAGVAPASVVGIGVDVTSCTVLPVAGDGVPLCRDQRWRAHRHAWPKLWKHHSAQPVADRLNEVALERGEDFLERYGGRISSEWYFPKLIELWLEDREVYDAAAAFIEATDWIIWQLTGHECRQSCTASYKAMWSPTEGLPASAYFEAAYPGFDRPDAKLGTTFVPLGTRAGTLTDGWARRLGLRDDVAVAVGNVDSFVSVPGAGVHAPGTFVTVIGTSICDMVLGVDEVRLPGITGVARDGILPGLYGYEAGQVAVGDMLAWFVRTLHRGPDAFAELEREAAAFAPGETGLVALDWFNGNRSILADADLTGAILGLTLQSTPAQIYRALLESIAFGNRRIIENFNEYGIALEEIVACGGIAERSPLTMQLIADTAGSSSACRIRTRCPRAGRRCSAPSRPACLTGSARPLPRPARPTLAPTRPTRSSGSVYNRVYEIYRSLYETLGAAQVQLLHGLKGIATEIRRAT